MATTTTNFGWTVPSDTDLVKDGAAAIRTALGGVDTSFVDLKGGTSGQLLSKNSNTDLDYTWVDPSTGDITGVTAGTGISGGGTSGTVTVTNSMATAIDAKGDLIVGTGDDTFSRLAVGTNGQVLVADSAEATGTKWASPTSGSLTLLSTTSLSGNSTTISSISSAYKNLYVQVKGWYPTYSTDSLRMRINGSTSSYDYFYQPSGDTWFNVFTNSYGNSANTISIVNMTFWDYANTTQWKMMQKISAQFSGASSGNYGGSDALYSYTNGSAISSINFYTPTGNHGGGSVLIYGWN